MALLGVFRLRFVDSRLGGHHTLVVSLDDLANYLDRFRGHHRGVCTQVRDVRVLKPELGELHGSLR